MEAGTSTNNDSLYTRITTLIENRDIGLAVALIRKHDTYRQLDVLAKLSYTTKIIIDSESARPMELDDEQISFIESQGWSLPLDPDPFRWGELSIPRPMTILLTDELTTARDLAFSRYIRLNHIIDLKPPISNPDHQRACELLDAYRAYDSGVTSRELSTLDDIIYYDPDRINIPVDAGTYDFITDYNLALKQSLTVPFKRARVLVSALDLALDFAYVPAPTHNLLREYPRFMLRELESLINRQSHNAANS